MCQVEEQVQAMNRMGVKGIVLDDMEKFHECRVCFDEFNFYEPWDDEPHRCKRCKDKPKQCRFCAETVSHAAICFTWLIGQMGLATY